MNLRELKIQYLRSTEFTMLSKSSQYNYRNKLTKLVEIDGNFQKILDMDVTNSTKNVYLSVLKTLLNWAHDNRICVDSEGLNYPRKSLKVTHKDRGAYSKEDVEEVWEAAETLNDKIYANFLRACFYTGCRPSELYGLTWECVTDRFLNLMSTKRQEVGQIGRKCAIIPQIQECLDFAKQLWDEVAYNCSPVDRVFRAQTAPYLNPGRTRRQVKKLGGKQLRHARAGLATAMIKGGYSIYDIQGQLGHSSIATTERYLRPSKEDRAMAYKGV